MKVFANISVTFTTLILLLFGASGIGVERCICTGKTTLVLPGAQDFCAGEDDCCGDDEDCGDGCDTTVIVSLSDYIAGSGERVAVGCWPLAIGCWPLAVGCWPLATGCQLAAHHSSLSSPPQPRSVETAMVLRV